MKRQNVKRPAGKKRQRRPALLATQSEIVTKEVLFDDTEAGGPAGRFIRMTANVDGREFAAELYDPFTGDSDRRFLTLCATPKQGEESNIGLYLTPAQINALAGIFASVRDKVAQQPA